MNSLPPLQTVRKSPSASHEPVAPRDSQPSPTSPSVTNQPPAPTVPNTLDHPALPVVARAYLVELLHHGVLTPDVMQQFLQQVGNRLKQLNTRERTAEALIGLKILTRYVTTRVLAGHAQGLVFGNYRVLDRLNSGSVGIVFRGEHRTMQREVAIKALPLDAQTRPEVLERFTQEIRLLSRINHPHIVTVHDAGTLPAMEGLSALAYIVMELVPGGDLENYIYEKGAQSVSLACEWARQIAMALQACHAAGLIHRDLKPSNILLTESQSVKLIDFGLARDFASTKTLPKMLLGSIDFLAPEQLLDAPTAGEPADVYSLGTCLFWFLTGKLPHNSQRDSAAALEAVRHANPLRLKEVRPDLPTALDALLSRMLSRQPGGRPTAAQVARELAKFANPCTNPVLASLDKLPESAEEIDRLRHTIRHLEITLKSTNVQAESARNAVLTALKAATALRPGESTGHQLRVSEYSRLLARQLSASTEWLMFNDPRIVDEIARVAAFHDLGLIGVAEEILTTPGHLSPSDRHAYESHPILGEQILDALGQEHGDALSFLRLARAAVRHHHERWDGTGFPDRLTAAHIPPAARIIAVADAYDTLRVGEHGQPGLCHADAVQHIVRQSTTAFDPAVIEAFQTWEAEFERIYSENSQSFDDIVSLTSEMGNLG